MAYQAVLFDFDYTLADATDGIAQSYNYALDRAGLPEVSVEAVRKTVGMTVADALRVMCRGCGERLIQEMTVSFTQKANEIMLRNTALLPCARPLLLELKKSGVKTGIVSTKFRYRIEDVFRRENLMDCIGVIMGMEDSPKPKPDPDGLLKAVRFLGCEKKDTLYAGDHIIDAKTALAAGIDFAAVLTGTTSREEFSRYPCRYVLNDAGELKGTAF